jgi:N-acetylglucosamine-6-phosphate deacetylase
MATELLPIPGFVDLQVNGFRGVDFSGPDLTEHDAASACRQLLACGTVGLLATVITSSRPVYKRNLAILADVAEQEELRGRLLGIHLEGPFISAEAGAVGAHNPGLVQTPDVALLEQLVGWSRKHVSLITIAPEVPGATAVISAARRLGITVAVGHTLAGPQELDASVRAGASAFTHLGNGMPNMVHRHENPLWAGLAEDALCAMIITDGHHLPPAVIKGIIRAKGSDRIAIVSDASPVAGLPPGRYDALGTTAVLEESGRLYNPEKNCLVGSSATMLQCMNHLASLGLLTLDELLSVGFHNPLRMVGLSARDVRADSQLYFDTTTRRFAFCGG